MQKFNGLLFGPCPTLPKNFMEIASMVFFTYPVSLWQPDKCWWKHKVLCGGNSDIRCQERCRLLSLNRSNTACPGGKPQDSALKFLYFRNTAVQWPPHPVRQDWFSAPTGYITSVSCHLFFTKFKWRRGSREKKRKGIISRQWHRGGHIEPWGVDWWKSNQHSRERLEGAPGCDGEMELRQNERRRREHMKWMRRGWAEKKSRWTFSFNTNTQSFPMILI